jgi:ribokinase
MTARSVPDKDVPCSLFVVGSFVAACSVKVERLPRAGETLRAQSFTIEAGGKGFNVAVAALRLGTRVDGVLAVGSDPFAAFARTSLERVGLPAEMLIAFPGATGAGVGLVDAAGENCIAVCPAANDLLSADEIATAQDRLREAGLVVAQFEVDDAPVLAAFAAAGQTGATRVLNPSPFRPIRDDMLTMTDVLVVNEVEAAALARQLGAPVAAPLQSEAQGWEALAQALLARGLRIVVVTLGASGAGAWTQDERRFQPAFAVDAVDTIGAGDAFLGGLCASLCEGTDLAQALRQAAACGAMAAARIGLLEALPTRAALADFIAQASAGLGERP